MRLLKINYSIEIKDRMPTFTQEIQYHGDDEHTLVKHLYFETNNEQFENFLLSNILIKNDLQRWKNWIKEMCGIKRKNIVKILKGTNNMLYLFLKN